MTVAEAAGDFSSLGLPEPVLQAISKLGFTSPTPIQAATIPLLLQGRDVLGQARTGTGKTGAFAIPLLARLDPNVRQPQVLVLTPTRELALQVAESFQTFATGIPSFRIAAVFGGQAYGPQLRALSSAPQVVVGTPGRLIDHLERGSLDLSGIRAIVLDEADEMLRMGFVDDVTQILEKTPETKQSALFSATMPPQIRRIARRFMRDAEEVTVAASEDSVMRIRQRVCITDASAKLETLVRIVEVEPFDAILVFTRTKIATVEVAEHLAARGFQCAALNGDMPQDARERTVEKVRAGELDILIATDVAARGLDVDRFTHVVNFDAPNDTETYVHRVGRTGRAGRSGEAILLLTPRERWSIRGLEAAIKAPIEPMGPPSADEVNARRVEKFVARIGEIAAREDLSPFAAVVTRAVEQTGLDATQIAAALARIAHGSAPFALVDRVRPTPPRPLREPRTGFVPEPRSGFTPEPRQPATEIRANFVAEARPRVEAPRPRLDDEAPPVAAMPRLRDEEHREAAEPDDVRRAPREQRPTDDLRPVRGNAAATRTAAAARGIPVGRFRIEVGRMHGVRPVQIVDVISRTAGLDSRYVGDITIHDDFSTVELPEGMPRSILDALRASRIGSRSLRMTRADEIADHAARGPRETRRTIAPRTRRDA